MLGGANLTHIVDLRQIRTPSLADDAEVRPRLPLVVAQIELDERYLCDQ